MGELDVKEETSLCQLRFFEIEIVFLKTTDLLKKNVQVCCVCGENYIRQHSLHIKLWRSLSSTKEHT